MENKKHIKGFNEMNQDIDWNEVEEKWNSYIEQTFGESDYDDEFYELKSFLPNLETDWAKVKKDYFGYIERTNNEGDYDKQFEKFKKFVITSINI
jgi:hypothetical protein